MVSNVAAQLAELIEAEIGTWETPAVERAIFGSAAPEQVARLAVAETERVLGERIVAALFYASSQGCVIGFVLAPDAGTGGRTDARRVVVKAHPPESDPAHLRAVAAVQAALAAGGYPCPAPLLGPVAFGRGYATVEQYAAEGEYRNPHEPVVRRAMAIWLARLHGATRALAEVPGIKRSSDEELPPNVLWPAPHAVIFDFGATAAGAEWIDALGWRARRVLADAAGYWVLGHTDWAAKHFRFVHDAVRVIYDWDSLVRLREPACVGQAARGFTMTYGTLWEGTVSMAPTYEELCAFVQDYEAARSRPFSAAERQTVGAAAVYSMGYTARCEHALNPLPGPAASFEPGRYRAALATYGERLLAWDGSRP